jgi:phosphopantothenoylcysteine decarboxylase / phosphopantothenate---cysteine ligase
LSEPAAILAAITEAFQGETVIALPTDQGTPAASKLAGRRIIVTSGPTHEPIDPVRYIANRSSGKQGHAIAAAAAAAGADVVLISGPVALPDPPGVRTQHVETAREMFEAVESSLPADAFIATAAVADWHVAKPAHEKIKKTPAKAVSLDLAENPDILATIAQRKSGRPTIVVGFAAETEKLVEHARAKLDRKNCDVIVANDVSAASAVMGGDENQVTIVARDKIESWPRMTKREVAHRLVGLLAEKLNKAS